MFFSGYTRLAQGAEHRQCLLPLVAYPLLLLPAAAAAVNRNEFVSIGESAVSQWGYTDGSPVPGMGLDATAGNQPRGTQASEGGRRMGR